MTELFEEIKVSFVYTFKDQRKNHFIEYYRSGSYWFSFYAICIFSGVIGSSFVFIWQAILSAITDAVFYFFIINMIAYSIFLLYPVLKLGDLRVAFAFSQESTHYSWHIKTSALEIDQNYKQYKLPWGSIKRVREFKDYFQFNFGFNENQYLPKRVLDEKMIEAIRANLYSCIDHNKLMLKTIKEQKLKIKNEEGI